MSAEADTTGWVVCDACTYPHRPEAGCDNPACLANPTLSREAHAALVARHEAYRAQLVADAERRALYAASFARKR